MAFLRPSALSVFFLYLRRRRAARIPPPLPPTD